MAGVEKEFPGAGELVSADLFPQDRLPEVRWDLGVERTEHAGAPCGPETASGTNSSYKARPPGPLWRGLRALVWEIGQGLEGAGKSQRKSAGWLSGPAEATVAFRVLPASFPPLPSVPLHTQGISEEWRSPESTI